MIVSGWEVSRGRSYELDKNSPGTASVTLIDTTGELDPASGSYPFTPGTPGAVAIRNAVTGGESPVFVGNISSYDYDLYKTEDYAVATINMVDGLDRLARLEMYAGENYTVNFGDFGPSAIGQDGDVCFIADPTGQAVANRINQVLNQADWSVGGREIFSGNIALKSVVYAYRTPCLQAILDAADAEFPGVANFYIQKDGRATFHGRLARFNPGGGGYHITNWAAGDIPNGSGKALVFELTYGLDVEKVINSAIATPKDIADADIEDQRYEDAASISQYGARSISMDNLLTARDFFGALTPEDATLKFAEYYVENYREPEVHISKATFQFLPPGHSNASQQWALLCGIDISDQITFTTSRISGTYFVEGLHYTASAAGEDYDNITLEVDLSPAAYYGTNPFG